MKVVTYKQAVLCRTVEEYNDHMKRLAGKRPDDTISLNGGFLAVIRYEETEQICETVKDEYLMAGKKYICDQCPLHDEITDRRKSHVACKYGEFGETSRKSTACNVFYAKLARGEIKPTHEYHEPVYRKGGNHEQD